MQRLRQVQVVRVCMLPQALRRAVARQEARLRGHKGLELVVPLLGLEVGDVDHLARVANLRGLRVGTLAQLRRMLTSRWRPFACRAVQTKQRGKPH